MRKIKEVQAQIEEKISEALRELHVLPKGLYPSVHICGPSRRKRESASFEKSWSPDTDSIQIKFKPRSEPENVNSALSERDAPASPENSAPKSSTPSDSMSDLITALDHAESQPGYTFVALKWFRDTALPSEGFPWANADSIRNVLREAIDKRLVLTSKVPNPRSPQFPVTAIRLNRLMPEVKAILGSKSEDLQDFQPVPIRGENLSATVLRERR